MVREFDDLEVYRRSLELAKEVYTLTKSFPKDEIYGMRDQIRRAVASVGANIAEGFGRYHYRDKLVFFYNARGSLFETRHFINLAIGVEYLRKEQVVGLLGDKGVLSLKLNNFISAVGNSK